MRFERWVVLPLVLFVAGCATRPALDETKLPPVSEPLQPFEKLADGVLARTLLTVDDPVYAVELREIIATSDAVPVTFSGAAVLEVRFGNGSATVDGTARPLAQGQTLAVAEGASLRLQSSTSDLPLIVAVTTIRAR